MSALLLCTTYTGLPAELRRVRVGGYRARDPMQADENHSWYEVDVSERVVRDVQWFGYDGEPSAWSPVPGGGYSSVTTETFVRVDSTWYWVSGPEGCPAAVQRVDDAIVRAPARHAHHPRGHKEHVRFEAIL